MSDRLAGLNQDSHHAHQAETGNHQISAENINQTFENLQNEVARNPGNAEAHRNLACALKQKGDLGSAVKHLQRALHIQERPDLYACAPSRIFYFCPDMKSKSGGLRRLYRHVDILVQNGFPASILHAQNGFELADQPDVPIAYLENPGVLKKDDIVVIPEGFPRVMLQLKNQPIRRFVIALSWSYIFSTLPDGLDWRDFNIERVMVVCPVIGDMVSWSMGLPIDMIDFAIDATLFYYRPEKKKPKIAYLKNKAPEVEAFRRLLGARNLDYISKFEWVALENLSQVQYAAQIRESSIFLNLSLAEGLLASCLEAMSAGCIVAGFNSVGGQDILIGEGSRQNCILAQNGDYVSLAYRMEPLFKSIFEGDLSNWEAVIENGIRTAASHTPETEKQSVIDFWNSVVPVNTKTDDLQMAHGAADPQANTIDCVEDAINAYLSEISQIDNPSGPVDDCEVAFCHWFEKICVRDILDQARQKPLMWQNEPLEWEVCHEILAYHHFCQGKYSLNELIYLSNNRHQLLDELWPGKTATREEIESFYLKSAQVLPWGHGVFWADHNDRPRRTAWLRRWALLDMLQRLGVETILDYGAGGGHTSLLAKAMGFARVIHHEYSVFNPYVQWRADCIPDATTSTADGQFVITDAARPLHLKDSVQAVICVDVAEHVHDPEALLAEIGNLLTDGGYLVWVAIFEPTITSHLHLNMRGKEDQLLKRHGFSPVKALPVYYRGHTGLYQKVPKTISTHKAPVLESEKSAVVPPLAYRSQTAAKHYSSGSLRLSDKLPDLDTLFSAEQHELEKIAPRLRDYLDNNQWCSAEELQAVQWRRIRHLLNHAYRNISFYRNRFNDIGLNPGDIRSLDDFRKIPVLTKQDIQQHLDHLVASNYSKLRRNATGGSTGNPLTFYRDPVADLWMNLAHLRLQKWVGYQPHHKIAFIWGADRDIPDVYPPNQRWLNSFNFSSGQIRDFIRDLVQWRPRAIRAYASSMFQVAQYVQKQQLEAPRPRGIETSAEKLWDHQRALIEDVFGCKVFDKYGSREISQIACNCEHHEGLHIFSDICLVETLNHGAPASPGEAGSITVTDIVNYGMPFIRYEIGDVGVLAPKTCSCGRGFPLLTEIKGRVTSTILTPDGRRVHGEYFTHLFYDTPGIKAFQVRQRTASEFEVMIQPDNEFDAALVEPLIRDMQTHLGASANVRWQTVDHIPLPPSGKHHFTISDIAGDDADVSAAVLNRTSVKTSTSATAEAGSDFLARPRPFAGAGLEARPKILFIVDVPGWAHDFKTMNLIRHLEDNYHIVKCYQKDVTRDDLDAADLILVYAWTQFAAMQHLLPDFERNRMKLLIGICSHYSVDGEKRDVAIDFMQHFASWIFVNNRFLMQEFQTVFDKPMFYTPNGVDTNFYQPSQRKPGGSELRVGWAGSLANHGDKRGYYDYIVPAIESVQGATLVTAAREDKWRGPEEMREFYRSLDVYICASRTEGTPNPCLEAAACGVPLLTTRVGNMPELVQHGVNGLFMERNVADIVAKLSVLKNNPKMLPQLGRAMLDAIRQWDWKIQAHHYRDMIEAVLKPDAERRFGAI
jgi:phenylacetate-coenzyme A ligase PaaK-like adenylate-forming protein/glycosyltransferase involved in cell wall biosynthesis